MKFPNNSLDPSSQPWVREVERRLRLLETANASDASKQRNSASGVVATLGKLSEQIAAIEATQTALQVVVSELSVQQAALTAQVARIDALVNNQVTVGIAPTDTQSGWASSSGHSTKASSSIGVPTGYSQAFVFALASMHFQDSAPNGGWVRAVIAGNAGGEMGGLANLELGQSASHTVALTGLSGGSIGIECQMRSSVGTGGMPGRIAQVSGFAIFLR